MTYIDYFVAAYYSKKSSKGVSRIINTCGKPYSKAREEYIAMKGLYTTDELTQWIGERIRYKRHEFIKTYGI